MLNKAGKAGPRDIDWGAWAVRFRTVALAVAVEGPITIGVLVAMLPVLTVFVHCWLHSWAGVKHHQPDNYSADVAVEFSSLGWSSEELSAGAGEGSYRTVSRTA